MLLFRVFSRACRDPNDDSSIRQFVNSPIFILSYSHITFVPRPLLINVNAPAVDNVDSGGGLSPGLSPGRNGAKKNFNLPH